MDELSKRCCLCDGRTAVQLSQARARRTRTARGTALLDGSRPRRDVVDAVDADEAIAVGCLGGRDGKL